MAEALGVASNGSSHELSTRVGISDLLLQAPALGRTASFGSYYDIRRDAILGARSFNGNLPGGVVNIISNPSSTYGFFMNNNVKDKLTMLKLDGSISLSILSGLLHIEGSGAFLNEEKENSKLFSCTYTHSLRLRTETFNVTDSRLCDVLDVKRIPDEATHVVTGIEYGAAVNVVFTYDETTTNSNNAWKDCKIGGKHNAEGAAVLDVTVMFQEIASWLTAQGFDIGAGLTGSHEKTVEDISSKVSVKVYADLLPDGKPPPTTAEGALELIKSLSERFGEEAQKETFTGCQIRFQLMPVTEVLKSLSCNQSIERVFAVVGEFTLYEIHEQVGNAYNRLAKISAFAQILSQNSSFGRFGQYLPSNLVNGVKEAEKECKMAFNKWQSAFKDLLVKVRHKEEQESELPLLFEKHLKLVLDTAEERIGNNELVARLNLLQRLKDAGINLEGNSWQSVKARSGDDGAYFLVYSFTRDASKTLFDDLVGEFIGHKTRSLPEVTFLAIDIDVFSCDKTHAEDPQIWQIHQGEVNKDFYKALKKLVEQCTMARTAKVNRGVKSALCIPLELRCPKWKQGLPCAGDLHEWHCTDCNTSMEYDGTDRFYCVCGWQKIENFVFRCTSKSHGKNYVPYNVEHLKEELEKINDNKDVSILFVGQTGVGKSTLINSLATYITHANFEDACNDTLINHIPTSFAFDSDNAINAGKTERNGKEESFTTQRPRSYIVVNKEKSYRLIDTPGIGNTGDLDRDRQHVESILDYISRLSKLSKLQKLHLICFVLPNDSEKYFNDEFTYAFREMVQKFHRAARENIVFCLTNDQNNNFKVSKARAFLKTVLSSVKDSSEVTEHMLFHFDNVGYRYLCAKSINKHTEVDSQLELYKSCYKLSQGECERLLKRATAQEPHIIEKTIWLNCARVFIEILNRLVSGAVKNNLSELKEPKREDKQAKDHALPPNESLKSLRNALLSSSSVMKKVAEVLAETTTEPTFNKEAEKFGYELIPTSEEEKEEEEIRTALMTFCVFVQRSEFSPDNDPSKSFKKYYLRKLIQKERQAENPSKRKIEEYEHVLNKYEDERHILEDNMSRAKENEREVTMKDVQDTAKKLPKLKHYGGHIREVRDHIEKFKEIDPLPDIFLDEKN